MSRLRQIKAAQIEAAKKAGEADPYQNPAGFDAVDNRGPARLGEIKKRQLAEAEKTGNNPYDHAGMASSEPVKDLAHYQAALSADLARLAPVKDVIERAKIKAELLKTYWPFVDAYIKNGDNYPNDVAVRVCIWLFDVFDIERGLDLAFVLIQQNQITPPKFDRDLPTFVCDAVYDWAAELLKTEPPQSASPYLDTLVATMDLKKWDLSPPVQSKMYVMLAKHKNQVGDYATCVALCQKAEAVNREGAGVKGLKAGALAKLKQEPKDE